MSFKSLPKTQEVRQKMYKLQKAKTNSFFNKNNHFFTIDSHQMLTQNSKFLHTHSSKSLYHNKPRSSSCSLLKHSKEIKNETFLTKKRQNHQNIFLQTKSNGKSNYKNVQDSKEEVLKIMQRLRLNNKLKIGQSTKYKLKDNLTQRMLRQKKQNIVSTSRIDLNQVINNQHNQFGQNINQFKQIDEKQKNLNNLQNTLKTRQKELQNKEQLLKQKQKLFETIREKVQSQKKKQAEIFERQLKQKQKIIKLDQQKLHKFIEQNNKLNQKVRKLQESQTKNIQQKKTQNITQKNKYSLKDEKQIVQQNNAKQQKNKRFFNEKQKQTNISIEKQINYSNKNKLSEIQSSQKIELDDIQQIRVFEPKVDKEKPFKKQNNCSVQNLYETPTFEKIQSNRQKQDSLQKKKLKLKFQKLLYQIETVTSIGEVPYYCSTSLKKSKYSWQLSCLLLYKYSYDKFLQLEDMLRVLVDAKLQKKQTLESKIQQNNAIKSNLIKIRKSVEKKSTLSSKIANFFNLQKRLGQNQKQEFIHCIYKQVDYLLEEYFQDRKPQSVQIQSCFLRIVNSILIIQEIDYKQKYKQTVISQISQINQKQLSTKLTNYGKKVKEIIKRRIS